jgi:nucleotide-binding universal stress UspA family protein
MALKDVLVLTDARRNIETRLRLAAELARRDEGHLAGLYVLPPMPLFGDGMSFTGGEAELATLQVQQSKMRDGALAEAARLETAFRTAADSVGVAAEWRVVEGPLTATAVFHARHADITVVGQIDPDNSRLGATQLLESMLLASGRPVLFVPYAGRFTTLGRNVLLAWNATPESARAANDALPILKTAERVTVLWVNPDHGISQAGGEPPPTADIALHLARHGVKAEASFTVSDEVDVGNTILSRAADFGSDLIVMGGYGHSRMREFILGGATRTILQHMTVPVLMSH